MFVDYVIVELIALYYESVHLTEGTVKNGIAGLFSFLFFFRF